MSSLESRLAAAASDSLAVALGGVQEAAVGAGLSARAARSFAQQTLAGTAAILEGGMESPAALKDRVASPGGTTIEGLAVLEDAAIRGAFIQGMRRVASGEDKEGEQ